MTRRPKQCPATSSDVTRCDRPDGHYGSHDGPIRVSPGGSLNVWRWT